MPEHDESPKRVIIDHLRQSADNADRIASGLSKAASEARVQADGYATIRDSLGELAHVAEQLPDEIYTNPSFSAQFLASDNVMRRLKQSMDGVLVATQAIKGMLESGKFELASAVTSTTSGCSAFIGPATALGVPILRITFERLEEYRRGLGAPRRDKVRELLAEIERQFVHQYDEVWHCLTQGTSENMRSAATLMRELVALVLRRLAPEDQVMAQPWYKPPEDSTLKVTRSQRVQYLFRGQQEKMKHVNALITLTRMDMDALSEAVHADPAALGDRGYFETAVDALDLALFTILAERTK